MPLPPPLLDGPIPPPNPRAPARSSPASRHSCHGAAPTDARSGPSIPATDPPAATAAGASSPPWLPAFSPARPGNAPGSGSRGLVHNTAHVEPQLGCHAGSQSATAPPPPTPAALAATAPNTSRASPSRGPYHRPPTDTKPPPAEIPPPLAALGTPAHTDWLRPPSCSCR